jgi:hypothetical protein
MRRHLNAENFVILAGLVFFAIAWCWGLPND